MSKNPNFSYKVRNNVLIISFLEILKQKLAHNFSELQQLSSGITRIITVYSVDVKLTLRSSLTYDKCAGRGLLSCLLLIRQLSVYNDEPHNHTVFVMNPCSVTLTPPVFLVLSQWVSPTSCPVLVSSTWICPSSWRPSASILSWLKDFGCNQMTERGMKSERCSSVKVIYEGFEQTMLQFRVRLCMCRLTKHYLRSTCDQNWWNKVVNLCFHSLVWPVLSSGVVLTLYTDLHLHPVVQLKVILGGTILTGGRLWHKRQHTSYSASVTGSECH